MNPLNQRTSFWWNLKRSKRKIEKVKISPNLKKAKQDQILAYTHLDAEAILRPILLRI
jgi:hypothetical protein